MIAFAAVVVVVAYAGVVISAACAPASCNTPAVERLIFVLCSAIVDVVFPIEIAAALPVVEQPGVAETPLPIHIFPLVFAVEPDAAPLSMKTNPPLAPPLLPPTAAPPYNKTLPPVPYDPFTDPPDPLPVPPVRFKFPPVPIGIGLGPADADPAPP